jgi:hypothetical protein
MGIFPTKEWTVLDLDLLKWASIFFGVILGAFFLVSLDIISGTSLFSLLF